MTSDFELAFRRMLKEVVQEVAAELLRTQRISEISHSRESVQSGENLLMTTHEAAKQLAISVPTLERMKRAGALSTLSADELNRTVTIRGELHSVPLAIQRSLSHTAYHVGQIILIARILAGDEWTTITIPRGGSAGFNERGWGPGTIRPSRRGIERESSM